MKSTVVQRVRFGSRQLPNLEQFSPADRREVLGLAERIDLYDAAAVELHGRSTQARTAGIVDEITRLADASSDRRHALQRMLQRLSRHDPDRARRSGLSHLADIGVLFSAERRLLARHERLQMTLERLGPRLDACCRRLDGDLAALDRLSDRAAGQVAQLDILIAAGTLALDEATEETLPHLRHTASPKCDPRTAEGLRRNTERVERFEQRLRELRASRELALQSAARIRSFREELVDLASAVSSIALNTVPRWKLQLLGEIALLRRKQTRRLRARNDRGAASVPLSEARMTLVRIDDSPDEPSAEARSDTEGHAGRRTVPTALRALRRRAGALLGLNVDLISSSFWSD